MTTGDFDAIMAAADPNMIVVTTAAARERAGCLVGFHTQSSIEPPRYAVWLSKANHTYRVGVRASQFAVHFLATSHYRLAERFGTFTGDTTDKFMGFDLDLAGHDGVPVLRECASGFLADRVALLDEGGDHVCIVLEPRHAWLTHELQPLRLSQVSHLEPGHAAD